MRARGRRAPKNREMRFLEPPPQVGRRRRRTSESRAWTDGWRRWDRRASRPQVGSAEWAKWRRSRAAPLGRRPGEVVDPVLLHAIEHIHDGLWGALVAPAVEVVLVVVRIHEVDVPDEIVVGKLLIQGKDIWNENKI